MAGGGDALLVKFNALGQRQWATYYANGVISGIAVDSVSNMYVTGTTSSRTGFATPGAFQTDLFPVDYGGGPYYTYEAFLAKFSEAGRRVWGTYYGNSSGVNGNTVTCDKLGHVYIGGNTGNPPDATLSQMYTPNGYHTSWGGGYYYDGYVARFDTAGKREWASLWGGNGDDIITAIACDANNVVYMAGTTASTNNIATPGSHQPVYAGIPLDDFSMSQDAFVVKLNDCFVVANPTAINGNKTICPGTTQTYTVAPAIACASSYTWFLPSGWKGNSTGNSITAVAGESGGIIGVQANGPYDTSFKKIEIIAVYQTTPPVISLNGSALMAAGNNTAWQWYLNDQPITGATGKEYAASKNGSYKVITTDQNGCADTSAVYNLALKGNLFVPNMFSPNGDGNNDVLKVYGNLLEKVDFLVFNQWGQKIYESHDVNGVWDGHSSGQPQPVGVYVYTLKVTLTTGEVMQKKGTVSLVR
jgi:gliding motility-associated-like protein